MMDPSLIDAFAARSLGMSMDEMLRGRAARLSPRRRTPFLSTDRPLPGAHL